MGGKQRNGSGNDNRLALRASDAGEKVIFDEPMPSESPPGNWDEIGAGDIVIAKDGEDGWWEAIVLNRGGDDLALAWQVNLDEPVFVRSVFEVAIPHPGLGLGPNESEKTA